MKSYKLLTFIFLLLALSGCATFAVISTDTPVVPVIEGYTVHLPTPRELNLNLNATQIVSAKYVIQGKPKNYTSQVQVEITSQKILLVAASGWGGELFSINYDGKIIKSSSLPMPNSNIGIEHTLTDFIFSYASPALLDVMLADTGITVAITPKQRIFSIKNKPVIIINYQTSDPWQGIVVVKNIPLNYIVKIQTVAYTQRTSSRNSKF